MLPNLPQQVVAYFGVLKAGAIVVNTNPTYPAPELEPLLRSTGVETVITLSGLYARVVQVQPQTAIKRVILTDVPDLVPFPWRRLVARQARAAGLLADVPQTPPEGLEVHRLEALIDAAGPRPPPVTIDPAADTAVLQFTGGTSGLPKAAELTHRNLVANVEQIRAWVPSLQPGQEKMLLALPAFHVYGMTVGMLTGWAASSSKRSTRATRGISWRSSPTPASRSIPPCPPCISASSTTPRSAATTCAACASVSAAARRCPPRWPSASTP
jgi:long-chain acyl-CoA synthetase